MAQQLFFTGLYTGVAAYAWWQDDKVGILFFSSLALINIPSAYNMVQELYPQQVRAFKARLIAAPYQITDFGRRALANLNL